jgi:hypothetical protein
MDTALNLIDEEVRELRTAMDVYDLVEVADALADIQYVLCGAVHECGMGACFSLCSKKFNGATCQRHATHSRSLRKH